MPEPLILDDATLARHAHGLLLCLAPLARGASFSLLPERPGAVAAWKLQGRRVDARVWAAVQARAAKPPRDDDDDDDDDPDSEDDEDELLPGAAGGSGAAAPPPSPVVQVVEVRGMLASEVTQKECGYIDGYHGAGGIVDRVRQALATGPAGVVVDILSPGGAAIGCGEAAAELAALVAGTDIPVSVYARQACSAAYYLAVALSAKGGLYVSESSDVGCIGTFQVHRDRSAANEQDGVAVTYIEDPPGKTAGNPDAPLDDEARARMQRDVSESTDRFAAAVSAFRPKLTDPRILRGDVRRGQVAVDQGLADGMAGSLADVVAATYARALLARPPTITTSPGTATPSPMGNAMQLPPELLSHVGLDPAKTHTDAAIVAALAPRLAFAAFGLEQLREPDPVRAKGVLGARLALAALADELEAKLGATAADADAVKRERRWEQLVDDGAIKLPQAFTRDDSGKRVYARWAEAQNKAFPELAAFLGWADSLPKNAHPREAQPDPAPIEAQSGAKLSQRNIELARAAGIDPALLALAVAKNMGGQRAADQEGV